MIEAPELHPDRVRLNDLVAFSEKWVRRAAEKLTVARAEHDAADNALLAARDRLAAWIAANPDPQMELI